MTAHNRRATDSFKAKLNRIQQILLEGDITFACVVLGMANILWGIFGLIYTPDIQWFAKGFALEFAPWVWALNHALAGLGFIHIAVHGFPKGRSLLFGSYVIMVWTWIAMGRPSATFSSGMTLNLVEILMGAIIVQRSGRQ